LLRPSSLIEPTKITPKPERIASLDFQRGLAIWIMTFLHTFEHVYNYNWVKENPEQIFSLPKIVIFIGLFIGFFASWNAYFLLISSVVNSLSMTKKAANGAPPKRILRKQLVTGFSILLIGYLDNCFGYAGYFGLSIRTGDWSNFYPMWSGFFAMYTLQIIGFSMIINGIIHYFLIRNGGHKKFRRNMLTYFFLALFIIILSPFVHHWVDNMPWEPLKYLPPEIGLGDHQNWPSIHFQASNASFKGWLMTLFAGDYEPLFPFLATSFAGSMVGLALAQPKPYRRLPLMGGVISFGLMTLGVIFITAGFVTLGNNRPALGNFLLMLGGQLGVIFLLLGLVEYRGRGEKFANRRIVKHLRLWGMISLSIYVLAIFDLFPRWCLSAIYNLIYSSNINLMQSSLFGYGKELQALGVAVFVIFTYELLVYLWSKNDFKYSFEWFVIRLQTLGSAIVSSRLNVDLIINQTHWINYKLKVSSPSELSTDKLLINDS